MEIRIDKSWKKGEPLGLGILCLFLFCWTLAPLQDYDFWFYLSVGRDILEGNGIPWEQSYLGTTSSQGVGKYADHAWLSAVFVYLWYLCGGPLGLVFCKSLLLTAISAVTYRNCRLLGLSPFASALWISLGLWTVRSRFLLRSYLFSDLGLAVLIFVLLYFGNNNKQRLVSLALLFCLWGNSHQGVIAGWGLLTIWCLFGGLPRKQALQTGFVGIGASFLRPHGWEFPSLLRDVFSSGDSFEAVLEWGPLGFKDVLLHLGPFFLITVVLLITCIVKNQLPKKIPWHFVMIVGLFLFLALRTQRAVAEVFPVAFPLLVPFFPKIEVGKTVKLAAILGLLTLFYQTTYFHRYQNLTRLYPHYPTELSTLLSQRKGQVFNSYEFGCYLDFVKVPPFIHSMTSLYKRHLIDEFEAALNASPTGLAVLDKYEVEHALLHYPTEVDATELLVEYLWRSPDWKLEAWDDSGLLFTRGRSNDGLTEVRPWAESRWNDPDKAKIELERLVAVRPNSRAHQILSELASLRSDWAESARQAELALQISPRSYQAWQALGVAAAKLADVETMLTASAQAVRWGPDRPKAHFNRALALLAGTEEITGPKAWWTRHKIRRHLEKTLELDPQFTPARRILDEL